MIISWKEQRKCDTRPCHTYACVQTNVCLNVWACCTPFALEPYCCLHSDWLRGVWKSTSVELRGGRPLVLPLPCLSGFQPGVTASLTAACMPGRGPPAVPTICLLQPNLETFDMSSCLRHSCLQHTARRSLKVHVTYGETCSKARYPLQLSPLTLTRHRHPSVNVVGSQRPCFIKPKGYGNFMVYQ